MSRSSLKNIARMLSEANQNIPVEQSFLNDLKRSIELTDMKNARQPSQTYKPSGMNCMRQNYYQIKGYEIDNESNSNLVGICESGTDRHERIQKAVASMKDNDIDCEYVDVASYVKSRNIDDVEIVSQQGMETKLYHKKYNMSFLCDGIIKYKNHYYILEIKTESSYKFMNRKGVDKSHYKQATAYSLAFGLDGVIFVYENRDVCDKKAFMFNVTDDMRNKLVEYIETCNSYIQQDTVPPKPLDVAKKTCTYCPYKKYCEVENDN